MFSGQTPVITLTILRTNKKNQRLKRLLGSNPLLLSIVPVRLVPFCAANRYFLLLFLLLLLLLSSIFFLSHFLGLLFYVFFSFCFSFFVVKFENNILVVDHPMASMD